MKKQIRTLALNKTKVSELNSANLKTLKGGKSGNVRTCPTWPLCFTQTTCPTESPGSACDDSVLVCDTTI